MKLTWTTLAIILLFVALAALPSGVGAKTFVTLNPDSGPSGSVIQVTGENFANGDVQLAVAAAGSLLDRDRGDGFIDDEQALPDRIDLKTVTTVDGSFSTGVVLPSWERIQQVAGIDAQRLEIVAFQPLPPSHSNAPGLFVIGETFTITPALPTAGGGLTTVPGSLPALLLAELVALGVALIALGRCLARPAECTK
jgi:hypothetical protein